MYHSCGVSTKWSYTIVSQLWAVYKMVIHDCITAVGRLQNGHIWLYHSCGPSTKWSYMIVSQLWAVYRPQEIASHLTLQWTDCFLTCVRCEKQMKTRPTCILVGNNHQQETLQRPAGIKLLTLLISRNKLFELFISDTASVTKKYKPHPRLSNFKVWYLNKLFSIIIV